MPLARPPSQSRAQSHVSAVAAPPAPTRLLMPTVRLPAPDSPALHWLGLPLSFDIVQDHVQVHGYQMYAVEKWIVERNRPVSVLAVYTGDPDHSISLTALSPSPALPPHQAQAEWDAALLHLRRDGARPKHTPHGLLMATSLAHFRSDYTIVHIPDGNFLAVREQLYTNINLLRMGCSGRSALTLEEPSDTTKDRFISLFLLPENALPQNAPVTSADYLPLPPALSKSRSHSHSNSVLNFHTSPSKLDTSSPQPSASKASSISKTGLGIGLPTPAREGDPPATHRKATLTPKTKDPAIFNVTVLELVKLIQAGLSIFGMYHEPTTIPAKHLDGLLCDDTVEGIRKWIIGVGEPCVGLEPMERIADPMFVSALLSLVLAVRNKLAALGFTHVLPKDPFLQPHIFAFALATYLQSTLSPISSPPTPQHYPTTAPAPNSTPTTTNTTPAHSVHGHAASHSIAFGNPHFGYSFPPHHQTHAPPVPPPVLSGTVLNRELVDAIGAAYEAKVRAAESRGGVRRVWRGKLEGFAGGGLESDGDGGSLERRGTMSGGEGGPRDTGHGHGGGGGITGVDRTGGGTGGGVGGGVGIASSGGQLLSGIGSFASGLGLGGGTASAGVGGIMEGTFDLAGFVKAVVGKEAKAKAKGKGKERKRESADAMVGYGYSKDKEKDGGLAISVRGLWSGGVASVVRIRQWEMEREMGTVFGDVKRDRLGVGEKEKKWTMSDGEAEDTPRQEKSDGRSTEEESDVMGAGFGGLMWGERVQKKLESWTGLARKRGHTSLDLSTPSSKISDVFSAGKLSPNDPTPAPRPSRGENKPISPTLPPMVFVGGVEAYPDDDDLLSSGQASPIEGLRPSPFHVLHDGPSQESTTLTTTNTDYERRVTEFNQKRPWGNRVYQSRVSSWADPVSARDVLNADEEEAAATSGSSKAGKSRRTHSQLGNESAFGEEVDKQGQEDVVYETLEEMSEGGDGPPRGHALRYGARRRRSFHDLSSLRDMRLLTIEQMRIDVELCGQLLIMLRREQHLHNVLSCLHVLTTTLAKNNVLLREDYQEHLPFLSDLEARTKVISEIDAENAKADKTSQAAHTLRYEAEQFRIPDLWHTATPPRQKVLELREKVFGTGGRRLPAGVHGAHGRFNRLQWTLDGRERLVDYRGRTESEAEEESAVDPHERFMVAQEEDEEDVVEHPGIKPMWLLRFFTSWGTRWGASALTGEDGSVTGKGVDSSKGEDVKGKPLPAEEPTEITGENDGAISPIPSISPS